MSPSSITLARRVLAGIIDVVIRYAGFQLYVTYEKFQNPMWWDQLFFGATIMMTYLPVVVLYSLVWEALTAGYTPGKFFMKVRVKRLDGQNANWRVALLRWLGGFLDFYLTLGLGAVISMYLSPARQRIGDRFAKSLVVRVEKKQRIAE